MFLMERCWTGVVNILGQIKRFFVIGYVYSPALSVVRVCCPEDMFPAKRQHSTETIYKC